MVMRLNERRRQQLSHPHAFEEIYSLHTPPHSFVVICVAFFDGLDFFVPPLVHAKREYFSTSFRLRCEQLIHVGVLDKKIMDHGVSIGEVGGERSVDKVSIGRPSVLGGRAVWVYMMWDWIEVGPSSHADCSRIVRGVVQ